MNFISYYEINGNEIQKNLNFSRDAFMVDI